MSVGLIQLKVYTPPVKIFRIHFNTHSQGCERLYKDLPEGGGMYWFQMDDTHHAGLHEGQRSETSYIPY